MIYEKDINMLHQEIPPQGARPGTRFAITPRFLHILRIRGARRVRGAA